MDTHSIHELKKELATLAPETILEHCIRLAKFKKENKELLHYLLYEAQDEDAYIANIKREIDSEASAINKSNVYFAKKTFRKILRLVNKFGRYSGSHETQAELLIHFCKIVRDSGIPMEKSTALFNLYHNQVSKIKKLVGALHEDLQYDYAREISTLQN